MNGDEDGPHVVLVMFVSSSSVMISMSICHHCGTAPTPGQPCHHSIIVVMVLLCTLSLFLCHYCCHTMLPLASLVASLSLTPFHHCCGTVLKQIVTRLDEVPHGEQLDSDGCTISEYC